VNISCKRDPLPEAEYEYCATFDTEMTFSTNVDVTPFNETFLIVVKISSMTWKFNSVIDSQRGSFTLWFLNPILAGGILVV